jgi:uncharacterized protein (DUF433 family)
MENSEVQTTSEQQIAKIGGSLSQQIEITPGVCGGKPRIAGHRIRVMDIVLWHEQQGWSSAEIIAQFPQLTEDNVQAALAYYQKHRVELEADIQRAKELEVKACMRHLSKLKKRPGS